MLRDAVEAWVIDPNSTAPIGESLSDIAQGGPDRWTITQVKHTGTSVSLQKALAELWTIDSVARRETPDLVSSLQYEVRCSRWDLRDACAAIKRWVPQDPPVLSDASLEDFRNRVSISCDPHPLGDLVTILANEVRAKDPLGWIHRWVGRLVEAAKERRDARYVGAELYADLTQLREEDPQRQLPQGVRLLSRKDVEPSHTEAGAYLVGEQPRFSHLREGCFAPRDWQVIPAVLAFQGWLEGDPFGTDHKRRVPLFWIGGRSGSGKSVLLLQVLARLVECGEGPLVWIGNRRHLLPDAMMWATRATEHGLRPIIALDDPFAPGEHADVPLHWQRALDCLDVARDDQSVVPILLACGPTEQARALAKEMADDIQIEIWPLDEKLDEQHLQELLSWFERRSGHAAPPVGQGDILMVQRFFEWRTGEPLLEFASRFRSRVEALNPSGGLTRLVAQLLAVNRLYAGLPDGVMKALEDADRDALEVLKRDHHIAIDAAEGRPGIWLAHPHLADALFRGWFTDSQAHQRAGALRDGILTCLERGSSPAQQTAPLWALARAWIAEDREAVAERIDRELAGCTLAETHAAWVQSQGRLSFAHMPPWLRLSLLIPGNPLHPALLYDALDRMCPDRIAETGFRLTCHILLSHLAELDETDRESVQRAIRLCLDGVPAWREWPFVAIDLANHTGAGEDGCRLINWSLANRMSRLAPVALRVALGIPVTEAAARRTALEFVDVAPGEAAWAVLYEIILEHSDAIGAVTRWARRNATSARAPFVLRGLVLRGQSEALEFARRWLAEHGDSPVASFLVESLVQCMDGLPTSLQWVTSQPDAKGWAHVLQKLFRVVEDEQQRKTLIDQGTRWLGGREDQPEWAHVLESLLDVVKDKEKREELIKRGTAWLGGREDRPEWAHVLQSLLNAVQVEEQRGQLVEQGVAWLDGREERREWDFVLQKLLDVVEERERRDQLVDRGLTWLADNADLAEWHFVLEKLLDAAEAKEQRDQLVDRGMAWLTGREDQAEWAYVLQKLLDAAEAKEQRDQLVDRPLCQNA